MPQTEGPWLSPRLSRAIAEVEALTGRRVAIQSRNGPDSTDRLLVQGYVEQDGGTERIWLDGHLPPRAREATAAHELAHVVQSAEGFPRVKATTDAGPLSSELERLAQRINFLVLDLHADRWAARRGFDVQQALASSGLPEVIAAMRDRLSRNAANSHQPARLDINTLVMAVDYAALRLRLKRSELADELERPWLRGWPASAMLGRELVGALARRRFSSPASCRRAMETVLMKLRVPPELISIN